MGTPINQLTSKEIVALPDGVEKTIVFSGAVIVDVGTGQEVTVRGPVDLVKSGARNMQFTHPVTGMLTTKQGVTLLVKEEDGQPVNKPLNILSRRLIAQLMPDLANGDYLRYRYHITAVDPAPKTHYTVTREPLPGVVLAGKTGSS